MSIEQRLHRAAHELRELPVDTPDFVAPSRSTRGRTALPASIAVLLLVVVGGILADPARSRPAASESAAADSIAVAEIEWRADGPFSSGPSDVPDAASPTAEPVITPRQEVAMIASLAQRGGATVLDRQPAAGAGVPERAA